MRNHDQIPLNPESHELAVPELLDSTLIGADLSVPGCVTLTLQLSEGRGELPISILSEGLLSVLGNGLVFPMQVASVEVREGEIARTELLSASGVLAFAEDVSWSLRIRGSEGTGLTVIGCEEWTLKIGECG